MGYANQKHKKTKTNIYIWSICSHFFLMSNQFDRFFGASYVKQSHGLVFGSREQPITVGRIPCTLFVFFYICFFFFKLKFRKKHIVHPPQKCACVPPPLSLSLRNILPWSLLTYDVEVLQCICDRVLPV
jgi:hypothetical protein